MINKSPLGTDGFTGTYEGKPFQELLDAKPAEVTIYKTQLKDKRQQIWPRPDNTMRGEPSTQIDETDEPSPPVEHSITELILLLSSNIYNDNISIIKNINDNNWSNITLPNSITDDVLRHVAYSEDTIVMTRKGTIYYSKNKGVTWNVATNFNVPLPNNNDTPRVMYADGNFYISTQKVVYISPDGINWTKHLTMSVIDNSVITNINTINNKFLVTCGQHKVYYADINNLYSWFSINIGANPSDTVNCLLKAGNYIVIPKHYENKLHYTENGINYSIMTLPGSYTLGAESDIRLCYGNNKYLLYTADQNKQLLVIENQLTPNPSVTPISGPYTPSGEWSDLAFIDGKFILVDAARNTYSYSTDLVNWHTVSLPYAGFYRIFYMKFEE